MLALVHTIKLVLSVFLSSACITTLTANQHHATIMAAAAKKLTQQPDNELVGQFERFRYQLDRVNIIRTKKITASRTCSICETHMNGIEKAFHALQEEYNQHSPALVILGPIGAAATVLKEKRITDNLFQCLKDLADSIAHLAQHTKEQNLSVTLDKDINKAFDQLDNLIDNLDQTINQR